MERMLLQLKKELVHLEFLTNHYRLVQIQKKVIKNLNKCYLGEFKHENRSVGRIHRKSRRFKLG